MIDKKNIDFSIVIPVFNNSKYINDCIKSIYNQDKGSYSYEIIIIDDCSNDGTFDLLKNLEKEFKKIRLFQTAINGGPGIARNIGIQQAKGKWILFLDSDDTLANKALKVLFKASIENKTNDIISYNFTYDENSSIKTNKVSGRYDLHSLSKDKKSLISDYLSLGMDGSVIFTLMKTEFLQKNNILFSKGYHEDVDFLFKVYYLSHSILIVDEPLYIKNNCKNSIVNTISQKHIIGFFRAYEEIFIFLKKQKYLNDEILEKIYIGIVGIVASRLREIWFHKNSDEYKEELYNLLYEQLIQYQNNNLKNAKIPNLNTRFFMIFNYFISQMLKKEKDLVKNMDSFLASITKKSWSCYDLHNSIFLAPNEIRVCCKRFFDDGKMKGDVVLLKNDFNIENILKAKRDLYTDINKGQSEECKNCPFLEFKEWGYIDKLKIEHISFEYHSICNMKCIYCSDKYYGGKKASYDVSKIIDELIYDSSLDNCKSIVWGGGEPTIEKNFTPILDKIANNFPFIKQRVITNSTIYKKEVFQYINEDKVSITTSIDAGSSQTFYSIRKNKNFFKVFENLKKYALNKPENITIKYIFMEENNSIKEIKNFVSLIEEYGLSSCNFQISFDFKKDVIDKNSIISMVALYGLLNKINARLIFFDDLLLQRLKNISSKDHLVISNKLEQLGYNSFLINKYSYQQIVIWGAGHQTNQILKTSKSLKEIDIVYLVDNDKNKINTKFCGYKVYEPSILNNNNYPIYISAVQNSPKILEQYKKLGIDEKRLVKGLLL